MDDEKYYMVYDFEDVQDEVYDDRGILHADDSILKQGDIICDIPPIHLEPGTYTVQVNHQQDMDSLIRLMDHDNEIGSYVLSASELDSSFQFNTDCDLYHFSIQFIYQGGSVDIKHMYLRSQGLFYSDTVLAFLISVLLVSGFALFCLRRDLSSLVHREKVFLLAFPVVFIFLNYVFFREYWLKSTGGDFSFWVGKIEQTKNELMRGQFPVQIYGDALEGHGVLGSLYPSLFIYFPAILRIMHVSMSTAMGVTFMVINGITMFTSYYSVKGMTEDRTVSYVSMVVYTMLPYRLGCLYFRFAFGELLAMMFIPIVILGLYEIFIGNKRKWWFLSLGLTGILQSHILSTVMIVGFCTVMGLLMWRYVLREWRFISVLKSAVLFFLLNLWFIIPFVDCYGYDLRLANSFAVGDFYSETYQPSQLFSLFASMGAVNERYKVPMIGPALWIFILLIMYYFLFSDMNEAKDSFIKKMFFVCGLFLFMQLRWFPWQTLNKFALIKNMIQIVQFPIRFGFVAQAGLAVCGGIVLARYDLFRKNKQVIGVCCVIFAGLLMIIVSDSWIMQELESAGIGDIKLKPDIDIIDYDDYAMAQYDGSAYPAEPVSTAAVSGYSKRGTHASFDYHSDSDTFADLPIQAYPGYKAYTEDGTELQTSVSDYAMLRVSLPITGEGIMHVVVDYVQPFKWRVAMVISIITFLCTIFYFLNKNYRGRQKAYAVSMVQTDNR